MPISFTQLLPQSQTASRVFMHGTATHKTNTILTATSK